MLPAKLFGKRSSQAKASIVDVLEERLLEASAAASAAAASAAAEDLAEQLSVAQVIDLI